MKLNLGCGGDVRLNYINVDNNPPADHSAITKKDFRNLNGTVGENSCDEILALSVLGQLSSKEMPNILCHWISLLAPGGTIKITDVDYSLLSNKINFNNVDLVSINNILYAPGVTGIYDMVNVMNLLESNGMTISRSYYDHQLMTFNIEATRDTPKPPTV